MSGTIETTWTMPSSNYETSKRTYETIEYTDGSTSCNCKGWTMKKAGQDRMCKHTRYVDQGIADQHALSVWHNPNLAASTAAAKVDYRLSKVAKQVEKERRNGFEALPARKVNWHKA
jgi:hypothetical protein